tara:strand:+ start:18125 stop:18649 length:525 start_codon:yes stop_codon:yes gene_type:complete
MNIFVLDLDPVKAAQAMDCVRVPKMVTESAQMMASALRRHGAPPERMPLTKAGKPYRGGYKNHPCTIWAGDSRMNFMWLATHALALCKEYEQRFTEGKRMNVEHACKTPILHMIDWIEYIPEGDYTPFAQAMPDEYKDDDVVKAYRAYYMSKIDSPGGVHYRHTSPPDWWEVTA